MWCPYCKKPSSFYHDYENNTDTCSICGKEFTHEQTMAYADELLEKKLEERSKYHIDPEDWQDFEDGWRPV